MKFEKFAAINSSNSHLSPGTPLGCMFEVHRLCSLFVTLLSAPLTSIFQLSCFQLFFHLFNFSTEFLMSVTILSVPEVSVWFLFRIFIFTDTRILFIDHFPNFFQSFAHSLFKLFEHTRQLISSLDKVSVEFFSCV